MSPRLKKQETLEQRKARWIPIVRDMTHVQWMLPEGPDAEEVGRALSVEAVKALEKKTALEAYRHFQHVLMIYRAFGAENKDTRWTATILLKNVFGEEAYLECHLEARRIVRAAQEADREAAEEWTFQDWEAYRDAMADRAQNENAGN